MADSRKPGPLGRKTKMQEKDSGLITGGVAEAPVPTGAMHPSDSKTATRELTIYDDLQDHPDLFLDTAALERVLDSALRGLNLNYAVRTRSKIVKQKICEALGYPIPRSFKRTQPRFPGLDFDTYVQKSDNLQIYNQSVSSKRRYVLIRLDENFAVSRVRVVTGDIIAGYDTTGTLTHKFQAVARSSVVTSTLVSATDTEHFQNQNRSGWLPIGEVFKKLKMLVGTTIVDPGRDQERSRGDRLHQLVATRLGSTSSDSGQFPDLIDQVLEVKMQTAPTIDLGLVSPSSTQKIAGISQLHHCDARYAVFYGTLEKGEITLTALVLTTGKDFFKFFLRYEGKNSKLQIPLPSDFFV